MNIQATIEHAREGDGLLTFRRTSSEQMEVAILAGGLVVARVVVWSQDAVDAVVGVAPPRYRP